MPRLLPSRAGLTTERGPMRAPTSASTARVIGPGAAPEPGEVDHRQAMAAHQVLEHDLVHGHGAGHHPGPGVRDAGQLQEALQRAVLAERAVDHQERDIDRLGQGTQRGAWRQGVRLGDDRQGRCALLQVRGMRGRGVDAQQAGQAGRPQLRGRACRQMPAPLAVDVDQVRLVALAVDGAQHRFGGRDAHLVLGRLAAGEDADPQAPAHACPSGASQSPTNSIS